MITCELIKIIVENVSGIEDIAIVNRQRRFCDVRSVYYELCRKYTESSLEHIGSVLKSDKKPKGLDHATVLNGLKNFDKFIGTKKFWGNTVYGKAKDKLKKTALNFKESVKTLEENSADARLVSWYYKLQIEEMITEKELLIDKYEKKLSLVCSDVLGKELSMKILDLELNEYEGLIERIELYLKVTNSLKKAV